MWVCRIGHGEGKRKSKGRRSEERGSEGRRSKGRGIERKESEGRESEGRRREGKERFRSPEGGSISVFQRCEIPGSEGRL